MNEHDNIARIGIDKIRPWTLTRSGATLYYLEPKPEQILMADICAHTSNICRFTGGTNQFYSVAQHMVFTGQIMKKLLDDEGVDRDVDYWNQILAALLHDAEEYIVNDMASPLKEAVGGDYKEIATNIRRVIFDKWGIDWGYYNQSVKDVDNIALLVERYYLMPDHPDWPKVPDRQMSYHRPTMMLPYQAETALSMAVQYALMQRDALRDEDVSGAL